MNKTKHPYIQNQARPVWQVLERGIKALTKNGDLEEKTARSHIVGYLANLLDESGQLADQNRSAETGQELITLTRPRRKAG